MRNKQGLIEQSLERIKQLELEQREALGAEFTQGSVKDTDQLVQLINHIIQRAYYQSGMAESQRPTNQYC